MSPNAIQRLFAIRSSIMILLFAIISSHALVVVKDDLIKRHTQFPTEEPPCENSTVSGYGHVVTITTTVFVSTSTSNATSVNPPTTRPTQTSTTTASSSSIAPTLSPVQQYAQQAQLLNVEFSSLSEKDSCIRTYSMASYIVSNQTLLDGQRACINGRLAQCTEPIDSTPSHWTLVLCTQTSSTPLSCAAVPIISSGNDTGVEIGCFSADQISSRFLRANVQGGMFPPGFQSSAGMKGNVLSCSLGFSVALGLFMVL